MQTPLITIGLEIHLKLSSESKIFCRCKNDQNLEHNQPNTNICPICSWQPGALPQLSAEVVEKGLLIGKALNCRFNTCSHFDRKSYFYPDLPMGYQITQLYSPINVDGQVAFFLDNYEQEKKVWITDAHLESDTAKALHQWGAMLLDFNRAGTPLIEIVTGPDFTSAEEAVEFAKEIQRIAKRNQLSDADMEKGQMRVDVNISIRKEKTDPLGTRVELKNINSFSAIKRAIDAEVIRQLACRESGETIQQQTRRRDDLKGQSFAMRSKEDALDYRYFPEPDLPPLVLSEELLQKVETTELIIPFEQIKKMKSEFWFHKEFINALINEKSTLDFFNLLLEKGSEPKLLAKRIAGQISAYMTAHFVKITELPVDEDQLLEFFTIAKEGKLIDNQLKLVMEEMLATGASASDIIKEKGFDKPAISEEELRAFCKEVIAENPAILEQYQGWKTSTIGFFVGQVMKKTQGKANPKVSEQLNHKILLQYQRIAEKLAKYLSIKDNSLREIILELANFSSRKIYSPVFGKNILFKRNIVWHILFSDQTHRRSEKEQMERLQSFLSVPSILKNGVQYRGKECLKNIKYRLKHKKGTEEKFARANKKVTYFYFIWDSKQNWNEKIKVVVKQVEGRQPEYVSVMKLKNKPLK